MELAGYQPDPEGDDHCHCHSKTYIFCVIFRLFAFHGVKYVIVQFLKKKNEVLHTQFYIHIWKSTEECFTKVTKSRKRGQAKLHVRRVTACNLEVFEMMGRKGACSKNHKEGQCPGSMGAEVFGEILRV